MPILRSIIGIVELKLLISHLLVVGMYKFETEIKKYFLLLSPFPISLVSPSFILENRSYMVLNFSWSLLQITAKGLRMLKIEKARFYCLLFHDKLSL